MHVGVRQTRLAQHQPVRGREIEQPAPRAIGPDDGPGPGPELAVNRRGDLRPDLVPVRPDRLPIPAMTFSGLAPSAPIAATAASLTRATVPRHPE